jgi:hypothetical protein
MAKTSNKTEPTTRRTALWEADNRQPSDGIPSILSAPKIHSPNVICKSNIMKFLIINLFFFQGLTSIFRC